MKFFLYPYLFVILLLPSCFATYKNEAVIKKIFKEQKLNIKYKRINNLYKFIVEENIKDNINLQEYDTIYFLISTPDICVNCYDRGRFWAKNNLFNINFKSKSMLELDYIRVPYEYEDGYLFNINSPNIYNFIEKWNIDTLRDYNNHILGGSVYYVTRVIKNGKKLKIETESF